MTRALAVRRPTGVVLSGRTETGERWSVENVGMGAPLGLWFVHYGSPRRSIMSDARTAGDALEVVRRLEAES